MHYSVYAGLSFAAMFGLVGPLLTKRVSPAIATWLLSIGSVISALSAVGALAVLAITLTPSFRRADPVEWPIAASALALLAVGAVRLSLVAIARARSLAAAYRVNREVGNTGSDLVVLATEAPDAYAVPGRPGRIFVTRGMISALTRAECEVMLDHERSHLRHRHHWHRSVVLMASALNPLLTPLPSTQEWLTERWADEDAARHSDRAVVASALSRAAAASELTWHRPTEALSLSSGSVDRRISALLEAPPRRRPGVVATVVVVLALSVLGTLDGMADAAAIVQASEVATPVA
jgi:Zn-dependent protease with chaperone function